MSLTGLAALAFGIQWAAFVPAFLWETERFYDLVGSLSYLTLLGAALVRQAQALVPPPRLLRGDPALARGVHRGSLPTYRDTTPVLVPRPPAR